MKKSPLFRRSFSSSWKTSIPPEKRTGWKSHVEETSHNVLIVDKKGKSQEFNAEACRITGYTGPELLSMDISDLLPLDLKEEGMLG